MAMPVTYLTTEQLSERIHYDARVIRQQLKEEVAPFDWTDSGRR
jgi:hypothetical protein